MNLFDLPLEVLLKIVRHYQYNIEELRQNTVEELHIFLKNWCYQSEKQSERKRDSYSTYTLICQSNGHQKGELGMLTTEIGHVEYLVKLNESEYTIYYPELLIAKNRICLLMHGITFLLKIRTNRPRLRRDIACLGHKARLNIFQFNKLWTIPLGLNKLNIHNISSTQHINLTSAQGLKELKLSFTSLYTNFPTWIVESMPHLHRLTITFQAEKVRHQSWSSMMYQLPNINHLEVQCPNLKFYNIMRSLRQRSIQYIRFSMRQQHYSTSELYRTIHTSIKPNGFYVLDFV